MIKQKKRKLGWFFSVQWAVLLAAHVLFSTPAAAQDSEVYREFSGNIGVEYRGFLNEGLYAGQKQSFYAFSVQPEYLIEWKDGKYALNFTGFGRVDLVDDKRNHWDIRELYFQAAGNKSEISVGLKKIYWGVTEAAHLVDIINQTDNLETFDGEQKLGQPMIHYSYLANFGTFDFFAMTYFRKRQFPGEKGRPRFGEVLDGDDIPYEADVDEWQPELAARWSHYVGSVDFGLSHFYGVGREPIFAGFDSLGTPNLQYAVINQTGLDIQATTGPILWKFESIIRRSDIQDMFALDAGLEYTIGNMGGSGIDLGLIGEYLYDDRGDFAFTGLQSDIFVGGRLAFNDTQSTELLFGTIRDAFRNTQLYSVEGSRRFGESLKASLEVRLFTNTDPNRELAYFFRDDDFVKAEVLWYF